MCEEIHTLLLTNFHFTTKCTNIFSNGSQNDKKSTNFVTTGRLIKDCLLFHMHVLHLHLVLSFSLHYNFISSTGSTEGLALIEYIMDHIASVTNLDPTAVRLANLNAAHSSTIPPMIDDVSKNADFINRKKIVEAFNNVSTKNSIVTNFNI